MEHSPISRISLRQCSKCEIEGDRALCSLFDLFLMFPSFYHIIRWELLREMFSYKLKLPLPITEIQCFVLFVSNCYWKFFFTAILFIILEKPTKKYHVEWNKSGKSRKSWQINNLKWKNFKNVHPCWRKISIKFLLKWVF